MIGTTSHIQREVTFSLVGLYVHSTATIVFLENVHTLCDLIEIIVLKV